MDIENRADSVFTDKTNTIQRASSIKQIFTKQLFQESESEVKAPENLNSSVELQAFIKTGDLTSITPRKSGVSKLKLNDEGEVIQQQLSIQADSANLPDGAFVFSTEPPNNTVEISDSINQPINAEEKMLEVTMTPQTPVKKTVNHFPQKQKSAEKMEKEVVVVDLDSGKTEEPVAQEIIKKTDEESGVMDIQNVQVISLETTTKNTVSQLQKSFLSKSKKSNIRSKHADGKRSVGLKSSMLKKRISKKAMSAKTSIKKIGLKCRNVGKMSVKFNSKKKSQYMKALDLNLKSRSKANIRKGYITPCKPSVKRLSKEIEIDVDVDERKSYLCHTAQSKNRALSRLKDKTPVKIKKKIKKGPSGKKKLVEPKGFRLRADARCAERKRLKEIRENKRRERELKRL